MSVTEQIQKFGAMQAHSLLPITLTEGLVINWNSSFGDPNLLGFDQAMGFYESKIHQKRVGSAVDLPGY